jgi:hypothetical protein
MELSDERLDAFIRAYEKDTGIRLARAQAEEMAGRLVHLMEILDKPVPAEAGTPDDPHAANGT